MKGFSAGWFRPKVRIWETPDPKLTAGSGHLVCIANPGFFVIWRRTAVQRQRDLAVKVSLVLLWVSHYWLLENSPACRKLLPPLELGRGRIYYAFGDNRPRKLKLDT